MSKFVRYMGLFIILIMLLSTVTAFIVGAITPTP